MPLMKGVLDGEITATPSSNNITTPPVLAAVTTYTARYMRFWVLVAGMMVFFGCHNYLQELIMSLPGFRIGVFLGYLEVLGVAVCSFIERRFVGETIRRSPWSSYWMLCFCLLISSATSNIALGYINYPTKVVFRSCKLIPTMIIAVLYNKKKVHAFEFFFGALISLGMMMLLLNVVILLTLHTDTPLLLCYWSNSNLPPLRICNLPSRICRHGLFRRSGFSSLSQV